MEFGECLLRCLYIRHFPCAAAYILFSAFRPRRWRGALLPHRAKVRFEMLESRKRPVSAVADDFEVRDVTAVDVAEDRTISMTMLYDAGHNLDERILAEQFSD